MTVWKCKQIFPTNTLMQNIEITDFKPRLAAENTSVLIILVTTVYIYIYIYCVFTVYRRMNKMFSIPIYDKLFNF